MPICRELDASSPYPILKGLQGPSDAGHTQTVHLELTDIIVAVIIFNMHHGRPSSSSLGSPPHAIVQSAVLVVLDLCKDAISCMHWLCGWQRKMVPIEERVEPIVLQAGSVGLIMYATA